MDNSTKRADLAAKTVAQDASKGKFWTQRKAVDVSAPKGVLKVRSSKDSKNNYYHYKFDPGQNTPVMYEPFRKETSAYVIVESDDCSPTIVQYNLRSQDGSKDAEYKKKNPLVSAGNNGYKNDNTRDVTVNGEQAFYLENIIIKDRAGNVRANDSKSKYTMARSSNVYLDVTTPLFPTLKMRNRHRSRLLQVTVLHATKQMVRDIFINRMDLPWISRYQLMIRAERRGVPAFRRLRLKLRQAARLLQKR